VDATKSTLVASGEPGSVAPTSISSAARLRTLVPILVFLMIVVLVIAVAVVVPVLR
jgi:hypothetical protein